MRDRSFISPQIDTKDITLKVNSINNDGKEYLSFHNIATTFPKDIELFVTDVMLIHLFYIQER